MSNRVEALSQATQGMEKSKIQKLEFVRIKWLWERVNDFVIGAVVPLLLLVIWQVSGDLGLFSPSYLPTPLQIAAEFRSLIASGELTQHLSISLQRAVIGFLIGGSIGLLFGFLVGFVQKLEFMLDPSFQMLRMIPHLAIAPLIILWFGFGEVSKIVIIANGAFFPMYIYTFLGIRNVDHKLFEVAKVLNFSKSKQIFRLILPAALPGILLGLRLSVAISWLGLVVAELIGSQEGIGFLINYGKQNSSAELIFVGVIIFAVIGKLVDSLVRWLERRWLSWRDSFQG
ncbi:Putative aliphatic sulfonates transport permease protein SsuC [Paenibacillus allorhizoplanae]|uniref:Aliphatic sulfonates transport permease protein SsuC n=1 Tax=Paenibacillus allorhizoplanae TaxID=2905648 RepID=A0ABN8H022_9BACL|nr:MULTISPECIES: ABC transporter permease [Paenibacillus]KRE57964.1 ABC transporter permease [Paenibacillus sp. Soil750]CAH1216980.1 Putative aliphatic sulfonates transport permease protein SsuC [Paenibacillus allorhizoplanae]